MCGIRARCGRLNAFTFIRRASEGRLYLVMPSHVNENEERGKSEVKQAGCSGEGRVLEITYLYVSRKSIE